MIQLLSNPLIHKFIADEIIKMSQAKREELFIATSLPAQRRYKKKMIELFNNQLDDVLTNLNRKAIKSQYDAEQIDWNEYRLQYNIFGQLELPGILSAWASLELEALEVGISFDVVLPEVVDAINARANLFSDSVVNETRDALHKVITQGIRDGYGIPQYEKAIRLLYENMSKYRSTRIARTEVIWGQNEGAEQSYIQSGVVEAKKWLVAKDERLCPFCAEMGRRDPIPVGTNYFNLGERLTVNNPKQYIFIQTKSGGYKFEVSFKASDTLGMTFNYEAIKHPPLHPHCRCCLVPVMYEFGKMYIFIGKWLRVA